MNPKIEDEWLKLVDAGWSVDIGSRAVAGRWSNDAVFTPRPETVPAAGLGTPAVPRSWAHAFEYRSREQRRDVLHATAQGRFRRTIVVSEPRLVSR